MNGKLLHCTKPMDIGQPHTAFHATVRTYLIGYIIGRDCFPLKACCLCNTGAKLEPILQLHNSLPLSCIKTAHALKFNQQLYP